MGIDCSVRLEGMAPKQCKFGHGPAAVAVSCQAGSEPKPEAVAGGPGIDAGVAIVVLGPLSWPPVRHCSPFCCAPQLAVFQVH